MAIAPGPRVLSIQQPWAWAIASGRKKVENRSWPTPYRGTVYIHASGKLNREGVQWLRRRLGSKVPSEFQPSAIVAIAEISDVVTRKDARRFGAWFSGPYGIVSDQGPTLAFTRSDERQVGSVSGVQRAEATRRTPTAGSMSKAPVANADSQPHRSVNSCASATAIGS